MTPSRRLLATLAVLGLLVTACTNPVDGSLDDVLDGDSDGGSGGNAGADPGDCIVVDLAVSSEKIQLLTDLAEDFNEGDAEVGERCVFARVQSKASGGAAQLLASD